MDNINNLRFILHVSDFHLSDNAEEQETVTEALTVLVKKLKDEGIKIDYLIHTGDVINSGDLYYTVAVEQNIDKKYFSSELDPETGKVTPIFLSSQFQKDAISNSQENKDDLLKDNKTSYPSLADFDEEVKKRVEQRFQYALTTMTNFISKLNVASGNVVICCGNHDILRPLSPRQTEVTCNKQENDSWMYFGSDAMSTLTRPFEEFLNALQVANATDRVTNASPENLQPTVSYCVLDDLNVLILNTNWINPKKQKSGYYCVNCNSVLQTIKDLSNQIQTRNRLNIILAHKPIYEICEKVRLSYKQYTKTAFLSGLQQFIGKSGIYLCGDKHTRSIVGSYFHDIPHYIGGEPIIRETGHSSEVEYNLLAITNNEIGMERKIHLSYTEASGWTCDIRPQDKTVKELYLLSQKYIIKNSFDTIDSSASFTNWDRLCQTLYNWSDHDQDIWYSTIDALYHPICRYRINGQPQNNDLPDKENIFHFVQSRIIKQMQNRSSKNILNIRGEHSSSKSMFLGLFYIHLLTEYSRGSFDFIPAYFNLESEEIYSKIEHGNAYANVVKQAFAEFSNEVEKIARKEHQHVCYIIDGLDELDCWSRYTEDSVGRELLNVLSQYDNAWYIMAFSQHNLPHFKNTMPVRKYNDISDIMYFNSIDVNEGNNYEAKFTSFVKSFLLLKKYPPIVADPTASLPSTKRTIDDICTIVQQFRRLTINCGFLFHNYDYLTKLNNEEELSLAHRNASVAQVYNYFVDRQNDLCLKQLGYGFISYAPAMAYLFTFKGYTYEKFMDSQSNPDLPAHHILETIGRDRKRVYRAFQFIMKNKDAREYLIALHYNRELQYYVEHPKEEIHPESILNEFITRNIAVIIRKLWTDPNKFVIVCEQLLTRNELSNCAQSMLIYCLAHVKLYEPLRNQLQDRFVQKGKATLKAQALWDDTTQDSHTQLKSPWTICGKNDIEKLTVFHQLSLRHSMEVFHLLDGEETSSFLNKYISDNDFRSYNRQYQMLYYGDLSDKNDANIHQLRPGCDIIYNGFDFHDCFNYLSVKLMGNDYPLREYDLFTLCDLIESRLYPQAEQSHIECGNRSNTFFYREKDKYRAYSVLSQVDAILDSYTKNVEETTELVKYFIEMRTAIHSELKKSIQQLLDKDQALL